MEARKTFDYERIFLQKMFKSRDKAKVDAPKIGSQGLASNKMKTMIHLHSFRIFNAGLTNIGLQLFEIHKSHPQKNVNM